MASFYPDVKPHMSPSALSAWLNNRSSFIKSYFEGDHSVNTKAMQAGTKIHRLIEAGVIAAKHVYDQAEAELVHTFSSGVKFLGKPDSHGTELEDGAAVFVDYKSGKANEWKDKLPTDLKMKATAWLVWKVTGEPELVKGYIEFIQTTWDPEAREVVPIEGLETEVIDIVYTARELEDFTQVILKAIDDVNAFYIKWQDRDANFINQKDLEEYETLKEKEKKIQAKIKDVGERLLAQMDMGGLSTHRTTMGTFYITERDTFTYPSELPVTVGDQELTLADVERIEAAAKAAKHNYQLITEPVSTSRSIGFKPPKA